MEETISGVPITPARKHSGFGIVSFIIALATGALEFVLVVASAALTATSPSGMESESPVAIILGLFLCGGLLVTLVGVALGFVGLIDRNRKKVFPILGILLNIGVLLGVVLLMVIGLLIGSL